MSSETNTIEYLLTVSVEDATTHLQQYERLLWRTLSLIQRMGLPDDVNAAIEILQRITMTVRMLHTAIMLLNAASGPIGWAFFAVGATAAAFTAAETASEVGRRAAEW